jgi:AP-4 complex subunit beta-1
MAHSQPPGSLPAPQFFDSKKSEINELRQQLRQVTNDRDKSKRREVIKKVIAYMTLGVDVSRLFTEMVMLSKTDDIAQKKMIYLYLVSCAESNSDLAIMVVNTFITDCRPSNPDNRIRGLALRSLCSMRFPGATEYLIPAITNSLADPDPYVRRTAIVGLVKLYRINRALVFDTPFINTLYELIRDADSTVSANAILVLNEVLENEGGIAVNRKMVVYLLNRLRNYNEFGQSIIFDLVARHEPSSEDEIFSIFNVLEEYLRHSSPSVVLGCIKVFLLYTKTSAKLTKDVYTRVRSPLITLFVSGETTGNYELSYAVLTHIYLLIQRGAAAEFESDFKHFFCKYDEPSYIKIIKIDILGLVASENNIVEILAELSEYVTDVDAELSKRSISAIALTGARLRDSVDAIVAKLIGFLRLKTPYIVTQTLSVLKDLMRKFRWLSTEILREVADLLEFVTEEEGKTAALWMLGEFGEMLPDAPYILEEMISNFKEFQSLRLAHALLVSTVKLFLKRAPEMQSALGSLLQQIFVDYYDVDLQERAAFYYKLLATDPETAAQVINSEKHSIAAFSEENQVDLATQLSDEFNTLSVVYGKPSHKFTRISSALTVSPPPAPVAPQTADYDLISVEEQTSDQFPADYQVEPMDVRPSPIDLALNVTLTPEQFQEYWSNLPDQ